MSAVVANLTIVQERDDFLLLQSRTFPRLVLGSGFLLFGGLFWVAGVGVGHPSFSGPTAKVLLRLLAIGFGLFGVHNLFNNRSIHVDGGRQQVVIHSRLLGLWSREQVIPFREVTGIKVLQEATSHGTRYWRILLAQHSSSTEMDHGSNPDYLNRLIDALRKVIGCSVLGTEWPRQTQTKS